MTSVPDPAAELPDEVRARADAIRLVIFDVDGVLTDGRVILGDGGYEYKAFHIHDGHGIRMLQQSGVRAGIITGRTSVVVSRRSEELGIRHLMQGRSDKGAALTELLEQVGEAPEATAFVGDDVVDLPAMRRVGLAIAVADAMPLTRAHAHWITSTRGGHGAAREVCELIMSVQGSLEGAQAPFLE